MNTILPVSLATIGAGLLLLPVSGLAMFLAGVALAMVGFLTGTLFPEY